MKKSKLIMLIAVLLPLGLFIFPLWRITLEAPQYPIPLGMNIHITHFSDVHPHDIKNIDLMNHYVGMKYIPKTIPEFKIFPICIISMVVLGLLIAFLRNHKWFLAWGVVLLGLSIAGIVDFYLWEYDYGHELNPKAIMKFTNPDGSQMAYQPPLWGVKHILNFTAYSYPRGGTICLTLAIIAAFTAFWIGQKRCKKTI